MSLVHKEINTAVAETALASSEREYRRQLDGSF